ncbi:6883_t:CDS:2, partial [Cetraspora pellucida]
FGSRKTDNKASSDKSTSANDAIDLSDVSSEEEEIKIASRITSADLKNDVKSLDRALQRTLYLIVKKPRETHSWQFPQGGVEKTETLVQAASRELEEECGNCMDVWFVGRRPIGYYKYDYPKYLVKDNIEYKGAKVFFMAAHIFAGQVKVDNKEIIDFAWVTKQEMKNYVHTEYYEAVKDML